MSLSYSKTVHYLNKRTFEKYKVQTFKILVLVSIVL